MPKKKSKSKVRSNPIEQTTTTKPWVRWAAIIVVFALLLSVMLVALTTSPSGAATPSPTLCQPIDSDNDGIINNNDPDIDGDGVVNGKDDDIDGDGVVNSQDNDPAATNCEKSTTPPKINTELTTDGTKKVDEFSWQWIIGLLAIGFGYLTLRRARNRK